MGRAPSVSLPGTRTRERFPDTKESTKTDRNLPRISEPSGHALDEICRALRIPQDKKGVVSKGLSLATRVAEAIRLDQQQRETVGHQRQEFRDLALYLRSAAAWIEQFDTIGPHVEHDREWELVPPAGLSALAHNTAENLGPVLTWEFLTRRDRKPSETPTEKDARLEAIKQKIADNPGEVLRDLFLRLALSFATAANDLEEPKLGRRSRKQRKHRHRVVPVLLLDLANLYFDVFGLDPTGPENRPFTEFLQKVLPALGLKSSLATTDKISDAVSDWRRIRRNSRLEGGN